MWGVATRVWWPQHAQEIYTQTTHFSLDHSFDCYETCLYAALRNARLPSIPPRRVAAPATTPSHVPVHSSGPVAPSVAVQRLSLRVPTTNATTVAITIPAHWNRASRHNLPVFEERNVLIVEAQREDLGELVSHKAEWPSGSAQEEPWRRGSANETPEEGLQNERE